jgi:excisionase family DNA binding protein
MRFTPTTIHLGRLLADEVMENFTQKDSDDFIKSLILYHRPADIDGYLYKIKGSMMSLLEKLTTSVVNYQIENQQFNVSAQIPEPNQGDQQYTIEEVCIKMSISRPTLYKWFENGLSQVKVGRRVFINKSDLESFLQNYRNE